MKLEDIRALIEAATPGPWKSLEFGVHAERVTIAGRGFLDDGVYCDPSDARFIAAARTLLPLLLDVAEEVEGMSDCTAFVPSSGCGCLGCTLRKAFAALEAVNV